MRHVPSAGESPEREDVLGRLRPGSEDATAARTAGTAPAAARRRVMLTGLMVLSQIVLIALVVVLLVIIAELRRELECARRACVTGNRLLEAARAEIGRLRRREPYLSS